MNNILSVEQIIILIYSYNIFLLIYLYYILLGHFYGNCWYIFNYVSKMNLKKTHHTFREWKISFGLNSVLFFSILMLFYEFMKMTFGVNWVVRKHLARGVSVNICGALYIRIELVGMREWERYGEEVEEKKRVGDCGRDFIEKSAMNDFQVEEISPSTDTFRQVRARECEMHVKCQFTRHTAPWLWWWCDLCIR